MHKLTLIVSLWLMPFAAFAKPLDYYLPSGEMYDASIPSPEAVLGESLGDRHLRHDQIISYLSILASSRPEAQLIDYGRTNEGRRLVLLAISSASNISQLEVQKSNPNILKIWNGFSVHGNESSGSNASVLYAWYLLATNNPEIRSALEDTVVLIDPSINPDGLSRFTTYVNNHRSVTTVSDPNDMSHNEIWPAGRTNHYWFDLNRDWLLLTQTESKARIKQFHQWQPHILTDHHEMGSAASFFFQPGVPSRKNPLISDTNVKLTEQLAGYHARALDQVSQPYYSKESFDDFYPGKGSTYPDLQGSIGILFEQARAMGGVIDTPNGQRSLAAGVRNQFVTAVSTLRGGHENRNAFIDYKKNFFKNAIEQADKLSTKGYLLDVSHHLSRGVKLQQFLSSHDIRFSTLAADKTIDDHRFPAGQSIYISLNQPQTTLVQSLFNSDTSFNDNTFYDVSAWHLGMAWGLPWAAVNSSPRTDQQLLHSKPQNQYQKNAVAYAFDWHSGQAPAALHYLNQQVEEVMIAGKPLNINGHRLPAGSFIMPINGQTNEDELFAILSTITDAFQVKWYPLTTALADSGIDLGSPAVQKMKTPKVMMLVGDGVDAYQAGSLWHLFDTQVFLPLSKVRLSNLSDVRLQDYTHIILPDGQYKNRISKETVGQLQQWMQHGGHLIALQRAANWTEKQLPGKVDDEDNKASDSGQKPDEDKSAEPARKSYAEYDQDAAEKILGGAIIQAQADLSHPLAFGTHLPVQHVLMKGSAVLKATDNLYDTPLQVTEQVRAAGYVSDHWFEKLKSAPLVVAERRGEGSLIKFGFNPNFRAFWYGTQRWIINAVFMADLIRQTR